MLTENDNDDGGLWASNAIGHDGTTFASETHLLSVPSKKRLSLEEVLDLLQNLTPQISDVLTDNSSSEVPANNRN
ncbi:hypothetical protein TNCV_3625511 [Trichonephila clavipes]|nr:hypothetical protein TNCV_3625511 [Trichonephila clavipes]